MGTEPARLPPGLTGATGALGSGSSPGMSSGTSPGRSPVAPGSAPALKSPGAHPGVAGGRSAGWGGGAASGASAVPAGVGAEELRLPAVGGDGARRRDDVGARRGASAHRLMGSVVRRLQEEADEERVEEDGASVGDGGGGVMPVAGGSDRADRVEAKRVSASGRCRRAPHGPSRPVSRGGRPSQQGRTDGGEKVASGTQESSLAGQAGVWDTSSVDVPQAPRVTAPPARVLSVSQRDPLALERPVATERVGRTSGMARLSWGAVLAAVVGLVALVLIGGFETPGTEGAHGPGGGAAPGDAQGRPADTSPGETSR